MATLQQHGAGFVGCAFMRTWPLFATNATLQQHGAGFVGCAFMRTWQILHKP